MESAYLNTTEPSPRNYKIAKKNLKLFDNIELIDQGLWNERDELEIQYGGLEGDDGFLSPDSGTTMTGEMVQVDTLENYVEKLDIDEVNFLKIEAEGAEPEIIEGIGDLRIENIVVNAGEERDGEPTGEAVMELLQPMGYSFVGAKGSLLFFTLEPVEHDAFRDVFK